MGSARASSPDESQASGAARQPLRRRPGARQGRLLLLLGSADDQRGRFAPAP
jgi:hypothetical protein